MLVELRKRVVVGVVGGSDFVKQKEQLGDDGASWTHPTPPPPPSPSPPPPRSARPRRLLLLRERTRRVQGPGAAGVRGAPPPLLASGPSRRSPGRAAPQTLLDFLGEEKLQKLINFTLRYISELDIPVKRGTFIEFRTGMLNISPIGRNCSRAERNAFEAYDKVSHDRRASRPAGRLQTRSACCRPPAETGPAGTARAAARGCRTCGRAALSAPPYSPPPPPPFKSRRTSPG